MGRDRRLRPAVGFVGPAVPAVGRAVLAVGRAVLAVGRAVLAVGPAVLAAGPAVPRSGSVTLAECGRIPPRLERLLVPPAGDHQPRRAAVGGLEQFEPLEAVLVVHRTGPRREPAGQLVAAVGRNRDRVDSHHSHVVDDASYPDARAGPGDAVRKVRLVPFI